MAMIFSSFLPLSIMVMTPMAVSYTHLDHSASKGEMEVVSPLILFKHVGTDSDEEQRARQALLGLSLIHIFTLRGHFCYDSTWNF